MSYEHIHFENNDEFYYIFSTAIPMYSTKCSRLTLSCGNSIADEFVFFSDVTIMIDLPLSFYRFNSFFCMWFKYDQYCFERFIC